MTIQTKHFGALDVPDKDVLAFDGGLPGFEHLRSFALLAGQEGEDDSIFHWLQSTEDASVAFVLIDMVKYNPEYDPLVSEDEIADLGDYDAEAFRVYNIAVIPEDAKQATVNLKAPIVINTATSRGKQAICTNDDYSVRHYLFQ